ncbi:MAG: hypothetical protein AAF518_10545, partial [Spirochaetota bacterium]
ISIKNVILSPIKWYRSHSTYNINRKENFMIPGINWPNDGKRVYQEDFVYEQNAISESILKRDLDSFGSGIVEGGVVTIEGENLKVGKTLAYNSLGQRIAFDEAEIALTEVPVEQTSVLVLQHDFEITTEEGHTDSSNFSIERRNDSYKFVFREAGIIFAEDVPLYEITHSGSDYTVVDKRVFKNRIGDLAKLRERIRREVPDEILDIVAALNWVDKELEDETNARTAKDGDLDGRIGTEISDRVREDSNLQGQINQLNANKVFNDSGHRIALIWRNGKAILKVDVTEFELPLGTHIKTERINLPGQPASGTVSWNNDGRNLIAATIHQTVVGWIYNMWSGGSSFRYNEAEKRFHWGVHGHGCSHIMVYYI